MTNIANNNRRMKKKVGASASASSPTSSTTSSTRAVGGLTAADKLRISLLQKFDRFSTLIDNTLQNDSDIVPLSLCSSTSTSYNTPSFGGEGTRDYGTNSPTLKDTSTDSTAMNTTTTDGSSTSLDTDTLELSTAEYMAKKKKVISPVTVTTPAADTKFAEPPSAPVKQPKDTIMQQDPANFASWLASQQFDASAIAWNGDEENPAADNNPPDYLSGDIFIGSDVGCRSSVTAGSKWDINNSYSRDELLDVLKKNNKEEKEEVKGLGPHNVEEQYDDDDDKSDDDGYVSLAETVKSMNSLKNTSTSPRWAQQTYLPNGMSVGEVWDKVASCGATSAQCFQEDNNSRPKNERLKKNRVVMTGGNYTSSSPTKHNSILKASSFLYDDREPSPAKKGHRKSLSWAEEKKKSTKPSATTTKETKAVDEKKELPCEGSCSMSTASLTPDRSSVDHGSLEKEESATKQEDFGLSTPIRSRPGDATVASSNILSTNSLTYSASVAGTSLNFSPLTNSSVGTPPPTSVTVGPPPKPLGAADSPLFTSGLNTDVKKQRKNDKDDIPLLTASSSGDSSTARDRLAKKGRMRRRLRLNVRTRTA